MSPTEERMAVIYSLGVTIVSNTEKCDFSHDCVLRFLFFQIIIITLFLKQKQTTQENLTILAYYVAYRVS